MFNVGGEMNCGIDVDKIINYCYKAISRKDRKADYTMELYNNNHSVFSLHYHLVLVVKYRRQVISEDVSNRLRDIFENIQSNYNIACDEWNYDKDHIHVLFRAEPDSEISKFINAYKSASSRLVKREFPRIPKKVR